MRVTAKTLIFAIKQTDVNWISDPTCGVGWVKGAGDVLALGFGELWLVGNSVDRAFREVVPGREVGSRGLQVVFQTQVAVRVKPGVVGAVMFGVEVLQILP